MACAAEGWVDWPEEDEDEEEKDKKKKEETKKKEIAAVKSKKSHKTMDDPDDVMTINKWKKITFIMTLHSEEPTILNVSKHNRIHFLT